MRDRKSSSKGEQKPSTTLRRSPRFLRENQISVKNPVNPKPAPRRLSSVTKNSDENLPKNGGRKGTELKSLAKSCKVFRKSVRLNRGANVSTLDVEKQHVIEKRVTRSSISGSKFVKFQENYCEEITGKRGSELKSSEKSGIGIRRSARLEAKANMSKSEEAVIPHKQCVIEKRVTRSSIRGNKAVTFSESDCEEECGDENFERKMCIGKKRKRYQVEEEREVVRGWTKEQELALQRAYFTAKPTPQFWKKVARMVPGKSAEECFDRIHSDHLTPSQPQTRSRAKKKEWSPLSFSASKLLSPADVKSKKLRSRRTLLGQKAVRQLLQKQQYKGQDHEADLFAFLEPTVDPSPLNFQENTAFASPTPKQGSRILTKCGQKSSSAQRKHRSRVNSPHKAALVSPPVLKQIKNKAIHEKYIDQLHRRDAKRKAESLRSAKNIKDQIDKEVNHLKVNLVKVAKDALVSDAQTAINQFRSLQSCTNCSIDDDDNTSCSEDGEDEDEFS